MNIAEVIKYGKLVKCEDGVKIKWDGSRFVTPEGGFLKEVPVSGYKKYTVDLAEAMGRVLDGETAKHASWPDGDHVWQDACGEILHHKGDTGSSFGFKFDCQLEGWILL